MDNMKKKEFMVGLIMMLILSVAMGALASFLVLKSMTPKARVASPSAPVMYLLNIVESVIAGFIVMLIIPLGKLGRLLAAKCHAFPPSFKFVLINCLPLSIGNAVLVSAAVSFINIAQAHSKIPADAAPPLMAMWFPQWFRLLFVSILVSYILAVIISPLVTKLVGVGRPPEGMPPRH